MKLFRGPEFPRSSRVAVGMSEGDADVVNALIDEFNVKHTELARWILLCLDRIAPLRLSLEDFQELSQKYSDGKHKDKLVVGLTWEEKRQIKKRADAMSLTMSGYIRATFAAWYEELKRREGTPYGDNK